VVLLTLLCRQYAPRFVAALCNGADFVKGSRFAQGGARSDITLTRRVGNRALNARIARRLMVG
jgi:hypothetical protein